MYALLQWSVLLLRLSALAAAFGIPQSSQYQTVWPTKFLASEQLPFHQLAPGSQQASQWLQQQQDLTLVDGSSAAVGIYPVLQPQVTYQTLGTSLLQSTMSPLAENRALLSSIPSGLQQLQLQSSSPQSWSPEQLLQWSLPQASVSTPGLGGSNIPASPPYYAPPVTNYGQVPTITSQALGGSTQVALRALQSQTTTTTTIAHERFNMTKIGSRVETEWYHFLNVFFVFAICPPLLASICCCIYCCVPYGDDVMDHVSSAGVGTDIIEVGCKFVCGLCCPENVYKFFCGWISFRTWLFLIFIFDVTILFFGELQMRGYLDGIEAEVTVYAYLIVAVLAIAAWMAHEAWRMFKVGIAMIMDQLMLVDKNARSFENYLEKTFGVDLDQDGDIGEMNDSAGSRFIGKAFGGTSSASKQSGKQPKSSGMCC